MPAVMKKCRVCGKVYEACGTPHPVDNTFRWKDVACSPECGAEYLRQVMEARGVLKEESKGKASKAEVTTATVVAESKVEDIKPVKTTRKKKATAASITEHDA